MRELFNQLMGKKPTMLTPSQMAMEELMSGVAEAKRSYDDVPAHGADMSVPSEGPPLIGNAEGGGMGSMAMGALGGATGALNGIMSDAQKAPQMDTPAFTQGNPIRDNVLARVRQPMRGLRYGGYVAPGEEVLVGEVAPEKVIARPDGGVEVVPLDAPQAMADSPYTAQERGMMNAPRMSEPERSVGEFDGVGYGSGPNYGGDGSQRTPSEGASGITMSEPDEGSAPPPRRSLLDTKRIIAQNNAGLTDEGVWNAREDVLREDQWKALNEPVKKSKWKDIGMMLLTSLNNQVNNRQDPVKTWGEIKRDEKAAQLAPQLQVLQQRRAEKQGALKQIVSLKHFDPKNPVHVERAKQAGLDTESLQGWDDRNPFTKKIGGREYQWDGTAFKPVNVPDNELVDYNVETLNADGTKTVKSFKVPKADAVKFATQLNVLGLQSELAMKKQDDAQKHSEKMLAVRAEIEKKVTEQENLQKQIDAEKDQVRKVQLEAVKLKNAKELLRAKDAIKNKDEGFTWIGNATGTAIPDKP